MRDPWKNLRTNDPGPDTAPAKRTRHAAGPNVLETADATYAVGQEDLNDNLDILLDRSYGATPARERDFVPGIDGLAGGKKWRPHVEFSVSPGNKRTMGQVNLFAPLMQDSDSLFYADLRASAWTTDVQEGNFGIGYRQIVPGAFFGSDAILGVYGFVDARHSEYDNMFYQGSLGAELITDRFEFRVNGYLPSGNQYVVATAPGGGVTLNGRDVVYSNGNLVERALPGFDVEAGVKIDFSEAAIRLNAGYFRFERGDTLVEGPRFRAEVEIDDPFGWDGAKLSIGGEIRDDKVRGTEASGLVRLRVPIGGRSKAEIADSQLSDLEKLMTRRINRDEDVVAPIVRGSNSAGTGAVTDAVTGETLQAFFVANTAQGAADCSSVANACDFATAQGLAGAGDTFLPVDIAGVIGSLFTLNGDRQQVIGAGGSGQAIVQLSDGSGSFLIVGNLGGRPIMTGVNIGHFADTRVAGIATNGAAGISGDSMTGTIRVNDVVLNNGGLDFGNSGAAINVSGATISSGTEDGIRLDHLTGSAIFSETSISTTSGDGVRMSASGGASVTFVNGLDIDTTTGTGLNASGGGTLSVGASGADESITSTAGRAVAMSGVDIGAAGVTFDSITSTGSLGAGIEMNGVGGGTFTVSGATTISGSAGPGINLFGNSAGLNFSGSTSITMTAAAAGLTISGATGGTIVLADLDIALQADGATALDLSGATLNANLTATDFDVTSTTAVGTTGVNLSGTTGAGIIRLGDADANGASATISGVNTGVRFTAATNATLVFGDGESATDQTSSISAVTAIAGGSTVTLGSYDFDDVNFTGTLDFASTGSQTLVFVGSAATGDGSGSNVSNLASAATADAIAASNTTFVLVNDGSAIDDTDGFTLTDGQTMASFGNGRTFASTGLLIPANFSGVPGAGTNIVDPTGNGAATLITSGAGDTLTASGTVNLQDFIISNTAGGDGLAASGATTITATGITIQNVGGQGIDLDNLTGPASTFDNTVVSTTTGNGVDIVNSTVSFTGGLDIDTTSGTGFAAAGGGTITVSATAGDESIVSTSGQAISLNGVTIGAGGFTLDSVSSSGAAGSGLAFSDVAGGTFAVSGTTTVGVGSGVGAAGIDFAGNTTTAFSFGATTITNVGAAANQTGIDFSGATLGGAVSFASVAISGPDTSVTSVGVNLTGVLGNQVVSLGTQTNPATGPSSSITDLHRGVVIDNTAAVQFTFGDGESGSDRGSSINVNGQAGAFTVDAAGGTLGGSSFDFNDVSFGAGDTANLPTANAPVFVSAAGGLVAAGTNNLSQDVTTITVAAAEAQGNTGQTFVFVGGAGGTLDLSGGGVDGFTLGAGQSVVSFNDGNAVSLGITQPVNLEGNFNISGVTSDNVTVGNSAGGATSVINSTAAGNSSISNFDISTGVTGILISGNTAGVTVTNVGITGIAGAGTGVSIQNAQAAIGLNDVDISGTRFGISNQVGAAAGDVTFDAASSVTNTTLVSIHLGNNASDFGFAGTISETDAAGNGIIMSSIAGTVSFSGSVALNTGGSTAVSMTASAGSLSFTDVLDIDTTSGPALMVNGGTISVAATAGDQSIVTTGGIGNGLDLVGATIGAAGLNFDSVNLAVVGTGINISGGVTGGDIVLGDVDISLAAGAGVVSAISISGGLTNNLTIADFDATVQENDIGFQATGALGGTISFGDFDIVSASTTGTVGIDIAGATGGTIRIGDTNTNGGSQITLGSGANPLSIGVRVDGTTNTNFTLGDANGTLGDLTASDIHATTAISGPLPTNGTYNFRDVDFNASGIANISGGASFFVFDEEGTAGAGTFADPGTAAQALAAGVNVLVAIDNSGVGGNIIDLSSAGQGAINTLSLDDNQALISLINGQSIDVSALISGLGAAAPASFLFTNVGGTTTITGSGVAGAGLATISTTGANNTVSLAGSAGIQSVNITNGGTGDAIFASYGAAENVIIRSSTITGGTGGDAIDIATTAGASTFELSDLGLTRGLRLDGSAGGTLSGTFNGTNTINGSAGDGIRIANASATISGVTFGATSAIGGAGIRIDNTDGTSRTVDLSNITMGSGGNGDTTDVAGIGVDINASGSGVLTVNLTGTNVIRSTGQALDVDETNGIATANNVLLSIDNTTFESGSAGQTVEITGQNVSTTTNSVGVRGFANNTVIGNGTAGGILFTNVDFDSDGAGAQVAGGTLNIGQGTGNRVQGDGLSLINASGDLGFTTLNVFNNAGVGLEVDTKGAGTVFNLDNAGGNVDTTNGTALFLDPLTMNLTFTAVNSTGANGAGGLGSGVFIEEGDASGGAGANALTIGTLTVTGSAGAGLLIENSIGTFNFGATTIDNTATGGGGVDIDATGGAADTLNVNFTGGLDIDTASGTGFDANVFSPTFNLQVANAGTETINTTTGRVLYLLNTNATGSGINFDSLTATGVVNGNAIELDIEAGTFNGGNVTIAGTSAGGNDGILIGVGGAGATINFTGATIDNATGAAINSSSAGAVTFDTVDIDGGATGVNAAGIGSFTISGGTIGATTSGIARAFQSLNGSGTINIAASLTKSTSGDLLRVGGRTAGSITLSGNLSATGLASGINVIGNTGGTYTFSGTTKTLNTGANAAVTLTNNTGATVNFTGGGLDIDTTSGTGFTATGGGTINVSGGVNTVNTATGQILNWDGVIVGASGVTFTNLAASGTVANTAVLLNNVDGGVFNGGTVAVAGTSGGSSDGIAIQGDSSATFNFTSATIDNTFRRGIGIYGNSGNVTFQTINIDGMNSEGIALINQSGSFTVNGGSIGASNDPGLSGVEVLNGAGTVSIAADITKTTGINIVSVSGRTGGTVTFSGNLSATGSANNGIRVFNNTSGNVTFSGGVTLNTGANAAVSLTSNTGATVNFTGGSLDIDTTSGAGFLATGGGTINVTGAGNNIDTATGRGLQFNNVTVGASGVSFANVRASGTTAANFVDVQTVAGGNFTVGNTSALGVTGTGILISGSSAAFTFNSIVLGDINTPGPMTYGIDLDANSGSFTTTASNIIYYARTAGIRINNAQASFVADFQGQMEVSNRNNAAYTFGGDGLVMTSNNGGATTTFGGGFVFTDFARGAGNAGGQGILVNQGGNLTITGGSVLSNNALGNDVASIDIRNTATNVTLGSVTIDTDDAGETGGGIYLENNAGTFEIQSIAGLSTRASTGIYANNAGTLTIGGGGVTANDRAALDIRNMAVNLSLSGIQSFGSTGSGVNFNNVSGTVNVSGNTRIENSTSAGLNIVGSSGTFNFTGGFDYTGTSATALNATSGGTLTIGGTGNVIQTTTGTAININNTTIGAAGITLESVSSNGANNVIVLSSTGSSGGLTITGTGTTDGSGGTIQNISGNAIQLTNTRDVDLRNMNLTNVASGNGAGSSVFGGNIANYIAAIKLNNVVNLSLNNLDINGGETGGANDNQGQVGISGQTVSGLTITDTTVQNFGNQAGEDNIQFQGLTGTVNITNLVSRDSGGNLFAIDNTGAGGTAAGGNLTMTVSGSTFDETVLGVGAGGLRVNTHSAGTTSISVNTSTFGNGTASLVDGGLQGTGVELDVGRGHVGTLTVEDSVFNGMNVAISGTLDTDGAGVGPDLTVNIRDGADAGTDGNVITGIRSNAVNLFTNGTLGPGEGILRATISGNTIGTLGVAGSGSALGSGIRASNEGGGMMNLLINNNTIQEVANFEAIVITENVTAGITNATITNNTIREIDFDRAIQVQSIVAGGTVCTNITGNTFSGTIRGDTPFNVATSIIRLRQDLGTLNSVQGAPTAAAIGTELDDANSIGNGNVTITGIVNFSQPACVLP